MCRVFRYFSVSLILYANRLEVSRTYVRIKNWRDSAKKITLDAFFVEPSITFLIQITSLKQNSSERIINAFNWYIKYNFLALYCN